MDKIDLYKGSPSSRITATEAEFMKRKQDCDSLSRIAQSLEGIEASLAKFVNEILEPWDGDE